jgi:DNA-binding transcriptional LysR family regulator
VHGPNGDHCLAWQGSLCASANGLIELRHLRYFVAVAEELHFGRAADRLHISQSPLSRTIRELERDLGVTLFVRTTRRVELTEAGSVLLERSRRALAEIDGALTDARRSGQADGAVLGFGYGPFSENEARLVAESLRGEVPELNVRLEEEVTAESLRRVGAHELAAAVVLESPAAARRHGVRIDTLCDQPLLAALPESHPYAGATAVPLPAFAAECVLLPREPPGRSFNAWLRTLMRAHGVELERTTETMSAPWDRRMLPVASGEAVSVLVADWTREPIPGVVAVPFEPLLNFPMDLASRWPPSDEVEALVRAAQDTRDTGRWLTRRSPRTDVPAD